MSKLNGQPDTPELDRYLTQQERIDDLEAFIAWVRKNRGVIAYRSGPNWIPSGEHATQIAARYVGIDLGRVEEEKQLLREHSLKEAR